MTILPGLTSTKAERIGAFLEDMGRYRIRAIALFPTCLDAAARRSLYRDLEGFAGLRIPHVHARSDFDEGELDYLQERFGTEAFNIHPRASTHPFGPIPDRTASRFFVENVDLTPDPEDLEGIGGLCPDYSHLENAALQGRTDYVAAMEKLFRAAPVGCCHLSAVRPGVPNVWSGEWDHHEFAGLPDLAYLGRYRHRMPGAWASLELENPLLEQLQAMEYLTALLATPAR